MLPALRVVLELSGKLNWTELEGAMKGIDDQAYQRDRIEFLHER